MIRRLQREDVKRVMDIWLQGNSDTHSFIPQEYWLLNRDSVENQLIQAEVYVYERDKNIIGFVGMQKNQIAGIFVKKSYRNSGIGKSLLDFIKSYHSVLTLHVYQKNYRAIAFYKREGFSIISKDLEPDTNEIDIVMCWNDKKD